MCSVLIGSLALLTPDGLRTTYLCMNFSPIIVAVEILGSKLTNTSIVLHPCKHIFSRYKDFVRQYVHPLQNPLIPPSLNHMVLYIAYCYTQGLAASTTRTHVSALSFTFQFRGFKDITQHFLIKKQLQGFTKLNPSSQIQHWLNQCFRQYFY